MMKLSALSGGTAAVLVLSMLILMFGPAERAGASWRSVLYPDNWQPGYKDSQGRFVHDFSYAGYRKGEAAIPANPPGSTYDVTKSPYLADNTGTADATAAIQAAINDAGNAGGGIVYLPAGTYKVKPASGSSFALRMDKSKVVLRGAGASSTFLYNDDAYMREKAVISVGPQSAVIWNNATENQVTLVTQDLQEMDTVIPVQSVSGYSAGDWVVVRTDSTSGFSQDHSMGSLWDTPDLKGVVFYRQIKAVDATNKKLTIDIPLRYWMKTRDNARVYKLSSPHLSEIGIEGLSIGMKENLKSGLAESDYNKSGTAAYEVHNSNAVKMNHTVNGWISGVRSYKPASNTKNVHVLSRGITLAFTRNITVQDSFMSRPLYLGGGGNGYLFALAGQESLLRNNEASFGRHNFTFLSMQTSGNVLTNCTTRSGTLEVDFHMHLSMANLVDNMNVDKDQLQSIYRPYGTIEHGQTTTQSVFWNTNGIAYKSNKSSIVASQQFGWGYVVGTRGSATAVSTPSGSGTEPIDLVEGAGQGSSLSPQSLYQDQLSRRLGGGGGSGTTTYLVNDSFNGTATGALPANWTVGGPGSATVQEVPSASDKSLKITQSTTGTATTVDRSFTSVSGNVTMEYKFRVEQLDRWFTLPHIRDSGLVNAVTLEVTNSGKLRAYNGTSQTDVQAVSAGTWYSIKLVLDTGTDKYDLYVNGTQKLSQAAFRNAVSNLQSLRYAIPSNHTGTMYVDAVQVYQ